MDTLWVPVAREVPIRTRGNKLEKWLLPGGEAGGAFLRELPQKLEQSREKLWERGPGTKTGRVQFVSGACPNVETDQAPASLPTSGCSLAANKDRQAHPQNLCLFFKARAKFLGMLVSLTESGPLGDFPDSVRVMGRFP